MKRLALLIISLISAVGLYAQTAEGLDASFEKARRDLDAIRKEFADSADAALTAYLAYEAKLFEEYQQFRAEVMKTWGDSVMVESSRKEWVEYSDDRTSRTSVDWETGEVAVEVLVDPNEDQALVKSKLEKAVADLLSSRGNANGYTSANNQVVPVSDRPLLDGQIDLTPYGVTSPLPVKDAPKPFASHGTNKPAPARGGKLNLSRNRSAVAKSSEKTMVEVAEGLKMLEQQRVAEEQRVAEVLRKAEEQRKAEEARMAEQTARALALQEQAAKEQAAREQEALAKLPQTIVESKTPVVQTVNTAEGAKNVVKITMELVEDHIPKRAEQFKEMISNHSSKYAVDEPLIYAIMEQESAFNPMAKSWVPAYGLMQLVPKSGGRDAYRYVHKTDAIPSAEFLFDPDNNIQLGTGYLKLLMSTTFKKVNDAKCRMLCAIAAYNTGAGNVSRALNGTTNISKAIPLINEMTYDQLFSHLKQSLPHDETKDYIQKVTSKMQKYIK